MDNVLAFTPRQTTRPARTEGFTPPPAGAPVASLVNTPDRVEVYTVAEVATMLSLSLGSTYALLRDGTIPARQIGRRWLIPRDRFHTWLDNLPEG